MIQNFRQWLEGHASIYPDITLSAMKKIQPETRVGNIYTSWSIIANQYKLNPTEVNILQKMQVFIPEEGGFVINMPAYEKYWKEKQKPQTLMGMGM